MKSKNEPKLALLIPDRYIENAITPYIAHVKLTIVPTEVSSGDLVPILDFYKQRKDLENLTISAQLDWSFESTLRSYGFHTLYEGQQFLEYQDIKAKFAFISKVKKAEDKFAVHPKTFGQYVQLLASGLKIKDVFVRNRQYEAATGNKYQHLTVEQVSTKIDNDIMDFAKLLGLKTTAAVA